jgi:dTDP-4-dehydrorhamnose 3,5-epimerase
MIFNPLELAGAFLVDSRPHQDGRGLFIRTFCQNEFREHGLNPVIAQANVATNRLAGTLRGLHFQFPPAAESKLVRVTRGAILDVIVDLRPESATFLQHQAVRLTALNRSAVYVPERFAHGYQTLEDDTEVWYDMGDFYNPALATGLSPFDPGLSIPWPVPVTCISEKDQSWKELGELEQELRLRMSL